MKKLGLFFINMCQILWKKLLETSEQQKQYRSTTMYMMIHLHGVIHKNSNTILDVFSVDTDVFILLTGHVSFLPKSTTLLRKRKERICIHACYLKLGLNKAAGALIGWYAFKGTDNPGACAGKGIGLINHYKTFLQSDMDILDAFSTCGITDDLRNDTINQMEKILVSPL